jgi:hypothetical protein
MMKNKNYPQILIILFVLITSGLNQSDAQIRESIEPPRLPPAKAKTAYQEGLRTGWMGNIVLTDNGFALGTELRRITGPFTELTVSIEAGGLRDPREQIFNSFYFGQITPNKYKRVASMPLNVGFRQRLFADAFDDNFRLHVTMQAGPTLAFSYPYFEDRDGNGIRDTDEFYNDVFKGWKQGEFQLGGAGRAAVTIDFGDRFKRVSSFQFGYQLQYFPQGIQIMQPNAYQVVLGDTGFPELAVIKGASKESFFGSPVISLSFGRFW